MFDGPMDRDPWSDWPYGAYEPGRAREIRELMNVVSDHEEEAADPDTLVYEEPPKIDDDFVEPLEEALAQISTEVESLEARLEHARDAERRLDALLLTHYDDELEEDEEESE